MGTTLKNILADAALRSGSQIYERAFAQEFRAAWIGTQFADDPQELSSLSYYRLLTCFLDKQPADIIDRRTALYYHAAPYFDITDASSPLRRYRDVLPTASPVGRAMNLICMAYDEPPTRSFGDKKTGELVRALYAESFAATRIKELYRYAMLCGVAAIRPYYVRGKMRYQILPPDMFRVVTWDDDHTEVRQVVYPTIVKNAQGESERIFAWWDAENRWITNADGKTVGMPTPHNYGRLPFAFMRLGESPLFWCGGMYDVVESALEVNFRIMQSKESAVFNSFSILLGTNLGENLSTDQLRLGAGRALLVTHKDEEFMPPELQYVTPIAQYMELQQSADEIERMSFRRLGIPSSMTGDGDVGNMAYVSRKLERRELTERRNDHIERLSSFEQDFYECVVAVANADGMRDIPINDTVQVEYADQQGELEPTEEYAFDKEKLADGVMSIADFGRKWGNYSGSHTNAEIEADIAKNKSRSDEPSPYKDVGQNAIAL